MNPKMNRNIFLFCVIALCANYVVASEKIVMCYYGSWATYRSGLGKFEVKDIDPYVCTHIVYSFVGINSQGTVMSLDSFLDLPDNWGRDNFGQFNALKQKNPTLKTILAVGGWNEGSAKYSVMAANPNLRKNFINSALSMILRHGFDGFDLDWEYPARRDTVFGSADIDNFTQLIKELRAEFDKYDLLLSAAVSAVKDSAALSYDIPAISKYLDFIGLMSYDMYGAWDPITGHNAPLHRGEGDESADRDSLNTVDVAVEYWLRQGCPPEKLVLGLPLYGRTFLLANANVNGVRAPSTGAGIAGPYTVTSGSVGYNEFCQHLLTESYTIHYDALAKVPYAVQGRNWISYDDADSITKKVEYALKNKLAGVLVWSIETDDFRGVCSGEDYPLMRAINKALGRREDGTTESESIDTTPAATTTTSTTTTEAPADTTEAPADTTEAPADTTEAPSTSIPTTTVSESTAVSEEETEDSEVDQSEICSSEGFAANPVDCASFFICVKDNNGGLVAKEFTCPHSLHWDQEHLFCNFPQLVNCSA